MAGIQTIQQKNPQQVIMHTNTKGEPLSAYELRTINEPWKNKKEETYRGDKTLVFYNVTCGMKLETELQALLLKLSNIKGWKQAFIYDNTGIQKRALVLHIKDGVIEENTLPSLELNIPGSKKQ